MSLHCNVGQGVYTYVPLSAISIIWYWPNGWEVNRHDTWCTCITLMVSQRKWLTATETEMCTAQLVVWFLYVILSGEMILWVKWTSNCGISTVVSNVKLGVSMRVAVLTVTYLCAENFNLGIVAFACASSLSNYHHYLSHPLFTIWICVWLLMTVGLVENSSFLTVLP